MQPLSLSLSLSLSHLSLDGDEHPESMQDLPAVVVSFIEVNFIDLKYDRLPVDIEASKLHRVCPRIFSADIADEVVPVPERLLRTVEMPHNMVHGGVTPKRQLAFEEILLAQIG